MNKIKQKVKNENDIQVSRGTKGKVEGRKDLPVSSRQARSIE